MMIRFYDILLTFLGPFIRWWGKLHWPYTHKKVTGKHYYLWRDSIDIGTVFLTKTNGELSNLINPTEIKHAGIYVGDINGDGIRYVFEAVGKGAVFTDLVTFLTTKDVVVGCRPNFIRDDVPHFELRLQSYAKLMEGMPYDYLFGMDGKAFYCFELAAVSLKGVYEEIQLKSKEILKGKVIYDENTFLDKNLFEIVFDSGGVSK